MEINFVNTINFFIQLQSQLEVLHWQTESYARHMAYGGAYDTISELADRFIEAYQGRYGKRLEADKTITLSNIDDDNLNKMVDEAIEFLESKDKLGIKDSDVELLTIRDEIVEALSKLKYLLTLK